jgi:hypothetical protein
MRADSSTALPARRGTLTFARHYLEMVVAMFAGMIVLGRPVDWLVRAAGAGTSRELMLVEMAATMTVPMVAWMRYRGHAARPCAEMAASMVVPTIAVLPLLWTGMVGHMGAMGIEHTAMLAGMLVAMLARRDEYSGGHHHARVRPGAVSA